MQNQHMRNGIEFAGERVVPDHCETKGLYHVHLVRYRFALSWSHHKVILDAACGTGYGTNLLAQSATAVVGIDIEQEAIEYAKERYSQQSNCSFVRGDICHLPFVDQSFDVVVSFETIEHVKYPEFFIREIRRVLRRGGVLLISTPRRSKLAGIRILADKANPYHFSEFSRHDFDVLLKSYFPHVEMYTQRFTNKAYYRARNLRILAKMMRRVFAMENFALRLEQRAIQTYDWMKDALLDDMSITSRGNGPYLLAVCYGI